MATYGVTLPITGNAYVEVEADSEDDAINAALEVVELKDLQDWEALKRVNMGNVCYAMQPWEAESQLLDEEPT
jgi:hypothetical protein